MLVRHCRYLMPALAALVVLAIASAASAATFTVNDPTDAALSTPSGTTCASTHGGSCTLRAAVQAADNTGGASTITLPAGDYKLTISSTGADDPSTGDLDVNGTGTAITINGAGATTTVIDANHIDRAFAVQSGESLSISGVTLENGAQPNTSPSDLSTSPGSGGAIYNDGSLSVAGSVLTDNSAQRGGGAVYADTAATATSITNSTITASTTNSVGGALYTTSGSVTLTDDAITHNSADDDGGVLYDDESGNTVGAVTISGGTISDNTANGVGGALLLDDAGTLTLSNTTVSDDDNDGGAIFDAGSGLLTVTDSTFADDTAGDSAGGAIDTSGTDLSVAGSTFTDDEGSDGGAIYIDGSSATAPQTITTSTFTGNEGTSNQAGAVYDDLGDLSISGSTFTGNNAAVSGGALDYDSGDGLSLTNDTFDGNEAFEGGAIYFGTRATTGTVSLLNDTIARNSGYDGGGIYDPADANTIENTIVAGNAGGATSDGGGDCYGSSTTANAGAADAGGNIDSDGTCFSDSVSHDHASVDPMLGPLSANGGPTETDALLTGSPAIGNGIAAACPSTDQRGVPRSGACDSGAYQTAGADLAIAASVPADGIVGSPLAYTLTVTNNGPAPATGVTVTDTLPAGTSYYSSSSSQGLCTGTSTVTCSLGTIDSRNTGPNTTATVTLVVIPSKAGTLTDAAAVAGNEPDPNAANNTASATTNVTSAAAANVAPVVLTGTASQIKTTSAKLSAIVNPAGESTKYSFDLGTSAKHAKTVKSGMLSGRPTPTGIVITVKSLKPGKTYHFRIVATNAAGTSDGLYVAFKTPKARRRP